MGVWKDLDNNFNIVMSSFLHDCDPDRTTISFEIKYLMRCGLSFENSVRNWLNKANNELQDPCSDEEIEYLVQQAIEDKEWLLR